ncbi:MAG TPA: FGGY-family carbohydrate kinase [bacterium]|nr:FGGY-family carbohydrate kinase [bacterium]
MNGMVALDIGTTSIRAILYDDRAHAFPANQRHNPPHYYGDGRVEQDPQVWPSLIASVLKGAAEQARRHDISVAGISLTSQRSSVIPVDRDARPLYPAIMWQDVRTAPLAAELAGHNPMVHRKTGAKINPVLSAIKMLWLKRNRPDIFAHTHKMLGIHDYALHILCGRFVTDQSLASRTNLLDLATMTWDRELIDLFELDSDMLCDLVAPGSIVGGLDAGMASETGLAAGTPVITAGGDQQCAALGLGLFSSDRAVTNTGTGSYLIGHSTLPYIDPGIRVTCSVSALPGAYIVEAALPSSGTVYRWFRETLWKAAGPDDDNFEAINAEAERAGVGAHGVMLLPHFAGSGAPFWDAGAKGLFYNLSLGTTRGDMARAILEGIALDLKGGLEVIEEACGPIASIRVSGGMTDSGLFNQIQADVFGRTILRYQSGEATSLGAWIAGAVATGQASSYPLAFESATVNSPCGSFEPDKANNARYAALRARAVALYAALSAPGIRHIFSEGK